MNGWQFIVRQFESLGVARVFGLPGTQNAELFSELALKNIDIVTMSDEKSAAFAAIGNAIGTGQPAILLTIAGPGFCYTAAPLVEATHDSIPLVNIVVGDTEVPDRRFQLQQFDHDGVAERLAKASRRVRNAMELCPVLEWAWQTATTGEPGPVVIHVDRQTLNEPQERNDPFVYSDRLVQPTADEIQRVRTAVAGKRVLMLVGRGATAASDELAQLVHENRWFIMTTASGRGVLPEIDPHVLRIDGCAATAVNEVIELFDVILVIGAKLTHNGSMGFRLHLPKEKLIHVDASEEVLNANYEASVAICCDAKAFCSALADSQPASAMVNETLLVEKLQKELDSARPDKALEPTFNGVDQTAEAFFARLQSKLPRDTIFVTDSGYHQVLARRYLIAHEPGQIIIPSDFQSMGFGLPAAIGLALANPERTVVAIHGDGGFLMCATDLLIAASRGLNIVICILVDGHYGLIRMQQLSSGEIPSGVDLPAVNNSSLAEALGVTNASSLDDVIRAVDGGSPGPILLQQLISESDGRTASYSRAQAKGRIRRVLGPEIMGWLHRNRSKK